MMTVAEASGNPPVQMAMAAAALEGAKVERYQASAVAMAAREACSCPKAAAAREEAMPEGGARARAESFPV